MKPPGTKDGALALSVVVVLRGVVPGTAPALLPVCPRPAKRGPDGPILMLPAPGCCATGTPGPMGTSPGIAGGPMGPLNCCGCGGCCCWGTGALMGPPWCTGMPGIIGTM